VHERTTGRVYIHHVSLPSFARPVFRSRHFTRQFLTLAEMSDKELTSNSMSSPAFEYPVLRSGVDNHYVF
jgi:hypothetical protein